MLLIKNLSKKFKNKPVIDNLSFNVSKGEILGLIGQNGAGKTTTFHSILNFIDYEGSITWNDDQINSSTFNEIGYLPEERSLLQDLSIEQHILYLASLKNMSNKVVKSEIDEWLRKLDIVAKPTDKIKNLSKGNQQKIQLICALIHNPKLLILDEPFSGLDPVNADLLKNAILELQSKGTTIIFSSHNMSNVESLCNKIVMLNKGKIVLNGSIDQIKEMFGKTRIYLETNLDMNKLKQLSGVNKVEKLSENNRYLLKLSNPQYGKKYIVRYRVDHTFPCFIKLPHH